MPVPGVLDRLRQATHAAHQALDDGLDVKARLACTSTRASLVRGYHTMHLAAERAMQPHLVAMPGLDLPARLRAARVQADLSDGSGPEMGLGGPACELVIADAAAALGVLYVMEGSSLGGRLILRDLAASGVDTAGLGFLDPYGARTGAMWRDLTAVLERELAEQEPLQRAVAGALAGFAHAAACLRPPP